MARQTKKNKAEVNKQIWDRSNSLHRQRWQTTSQKGYDFYLNEKSGGNLNFKFSNILLNYFRLFFRRKGKINQNPNFYIQSI